MSNEEDQGDSRARVDAGVRSGGLDGELVDRARDFWEQHVRVGLRLPNGEHVTVTDERFNHVLFRESRILRKPERVVRLIAAVSAIHTARYGHRAALGQWQEGEITIYGYAILNAQGFLLTAHIVDLKKLRKLARDGELLWQHDTFPSSGTDPTVTF